MFAGVHGNESAGALAVLDLLADIKRNPVFYDKLTICVVTPLNPVGFAQQSRYNEIGRDINRDFNNFVTIGGRLQRDVINRFKPDAVISLHEGPQEGFFVIAENSVPKDWRGTISGVLRDRHIALSRKSFFGMLIGKGYWRKGRLVYALQRLLGIYTLGRYAYERGIPLLTTESSWGSRDFADRKRAHVLVVRSVVSSLSS